MATVPAPTLIGVQRVVIACEFDSSIAQPQRRPICEQLVKKARTVTSLPVAIATADDLQSPDLARLAEQLLLRVDVKAKAVATGRKSLAMTVTPVRLARPQGKMGALTASAMLVKVQDDWVVQGPIEPFIALLAGAPPKLHKPIVSDR